MAYLWMENRWVYWELLLICAKEQLQSRWWLFCLPEPIYAKASRELEVADALYESDIHTNWGLCFIWCCIALALKFSFWSSSGQIIWSIGSWSHHWCQHSVTAFMQGLLLRNGDFRKAVGLPSLAEMKELGEKLANASRPNIAGNIPPKFPSPPPPGTKLWTNCNFIELFSVSQLDYQYHMKIE